ELPVAIVTVSVVVPTTGAVVAGLKVIACGPTRADFGCVTFAMVASPYWPEALLPQHLISPDVVIAQVKLSPAVIAAMPLVRPATSAGVECALASDEPLPVT